MRISYISLKACVLFCLLAFVKFVDAWLGKVLLPMIKPLLYSEGGPVIMVQVGKLHILLILGVSIITIQNNVFKNLLSLEMHINVKL